MCIAAFINEIQYHSHCYASIKVIINFPSSEEENLISFVLYAINNTLRIRHKVDCRLHKRKNHPYI